MYDEFGREFRYVCPSCNEDVEGCQDPACAGVAHHVGEVPEWCDHQDDDVPLKGARKRFTGRMMNEAQHGS